MVQRNGEATKARTARVERRPNLLLISIDTLRADHVGAYGATSGATPRLDAFARTALVFTLEAPFAALFLIGYSYTKRFTWASHWILGFTDGIATAGGGTAGGAPSPPRGSSTSSSPRTSSRSATCWRRSCRRNRPGRH